MLTRTALVACLIAFAALTTAAFAQVERNHLFIREKGVVEYKTSTGNDWSSIIASHFITSDNDIRTMKDSKAHLRFFISSTDVARVALLENVQLSVRRLDLASNVRTVTLSQKNGRIWVDAQVKDGMKQNFSVETPSATIAIRGTRFYSEVADDGSTRSGCAEGYVAVTGQGKTVVLRPGFFTVVQPGSAPTPPAWDTQEFGPRPRQMAPAINIDFRGIFVPRGNYGSVPSSDGRAPVTNGNVDRPSNNTTVPTTSVPGR